MMIATAGSTTWSRRSVFTTRLIHRSRRSVWSGVSPSPGLAFHLGMAAVSQEQTTAFAAGRAAGTMAWWSLA
jgi:hypothetical protein